MRMDEITVKDYEDALKYNRELTRELDKIMNGKNAARQAALCDIVSQLKDDWGLFKEARDMLVMASLIDKSGHCSELVERIDARHPEFNK